LLAAKASPYRSILLDVEGTTSPISFVYGTLFPYARKRMGSFLQEHSSDPAVMAVFRELRSMNPSDVLAGAPKISEISGTSGQDLVRECTDYLLWLMQQDRKAAPLKTLQGLIWKQGFEQGELQGEMFDDVPVCLLQWHQAGLRTAIYSSGSVLAQKMMFSHTAHGDLTNLISAYFDTGVGPKRQPQSYTRIVSELQVPAEQVIFVSDVAEELEAARTAGLGTALSIRPGNQEQNGAAGYRAIHSLAELFS
jgi:enolase-phosphatase E1